MAGSVARVDRATGKRGKRGWGEKAEVMRGIFGEEASPSSRARWPSAEGRPTAGKEGEEREEEHGNNEGEATEADEAAEVVAAAAPEEEEEEEEEEEDEEDDEEEEDVEEAEEAEEDGRGSSSSKKMLFLTMERPCARFASISSARCLF